MSRLAGDVNNWEGYACVGQEVYGKSLYLPPNSAVNLKMHLKIKSYFKKKSTYQAKLMIS